MKVLNQEAIRRMISGGTSGAVSVSVGGGGDGGLTPAWVEGNYISKSFFSQLFTIHGTKTVTDPQTGTTTEEEVEITPNQLIDDEYDVTDVEVKFGLWTQQFLSALGKNSSGGGGGGDTLTEPLASINSAGLGAPTAAGQVITWNGSAWIFDIPQGGGGGGSVTSVGLSAPTGFTVNNSPVTSSGTIQLGFATGYSLPTNAKQSNWDAAYSWGNHANAGYLTSSDIQDMATETWVGENYLPLTGGTLTGSLRMGEEEAGSSPYIYWGDGSYVYIGEDADDHMVIRGRYGVNIITDSGQVAQWNNHTLATQTWVNDQGFVKSSGVTSVGMSVPSGLRVNSAASATITGSGTFALSVQSGYFIPTTLQRTTWNGKQDAISDLTTIRSGAALGATAVQPSAITDMATKTWVGNQGYLTSVAFSDLTSHPTTLSGYGITDALPLSGGTMTGQIYSTVGAGSWIEGRDKALIRKGITNTTSWWPILSVKTADGSWEMGAISDNDNVKNALVLSYATDENYNANNNNVMRILFPKSAGTLALLSDNVASATKLATARTLWGQSFDGTANVSGNMSSVGFITMSGNLTMNNNTAFRMKDNSENIVSIMTIDSGGNFVIGETVDIYSHNTYIRGAHIIFQQGVTSAGRKELMRISPDSVKFYCGQTTEVASIYKDSERQGVKIGDALLSWDSKNNALKVQRYDGTAVNLYSLGGVSALGMSGGTSPEISNLTVNNTLTVGGELNVGDAYMNSDGDIGAKRVFLAEGIFLYFDQNEVKFNLNGTIYRLYKIQA